MKRKAAQVERLSVADGVGGKNVEPRVPRENGSHLVWSGSFAAKAALSHTLRQPARDDASLDKHA
jgi:hypothetical protein